MLVIYLLLSICILCQLLIILLIIITVTLQVAKCFEAILGCIAVQCGTNAAQELLRSWGCGYLYQRHLCIPLNAFSGRADYAEAVNCLWQLFAETSLYQLEVQLGHVFNSKSFLLQAVTHESCTVNRVSLMSSMMTG